MSLKNLVMILLAVNLQFIECAATDQENVM
jgi:hypothetical protein